ncbi:MAG: chemotaxis protein CheW [Geminocystis sp.]|nr:chemotaxis protein CheW [Geminocystis sp.]HIK36637.1 chemotaxis protein CheW [Geminocystis sp. M7585_C2015_104]MCS7147907.1 chemotaxis protein CheW [Geminocystis sp.]MCX8078734.1 chemotaxis protein CheW [Geminocystis sp.]MDW8116898.1 chemotaxis protein CheW [Geminocystis sp.]
MRSDFGFGQTGGGVKVKLLVFEVGSLNAALHIDVVQRVVNYTTIFGSGLNPFGVVHLEDKEVTVIDLHKMLFNTPQPLNPKGRKYLLLARNSVNEVFGIVITSPPELYDIPLKAIRVLPASYRKADTLRIASHVAVMGEEGEEKTIFILDPDQLIPQ